MNLLRSNSCSEHTCSLRSHDQAQLALISANQATVLDAEKGRRVHFAGHADKGAAAGLCQTDRPAQQPPAAPAVVQPQQQLESSTPGSSTGRPGQPEALGPMRPAPLPSGLPDGTHMCTANPIAVPPAPGRGLPSERDDQPCPLYLPVISLVAQSVPPAPEPSQDLLSLLGAWSLTRIWDTGCCCHPLTDVPCLRPGPRRRHQHTKGAVS